MASSLVSLQRGAGRPMPLPRGPPGPSVSSGPLQRGPLPLSPAPSPLKLQHPSLPLLANSFYH